MNPPPTTVNFYDDPPTIPCKFCPRKFHTLQAFSCHQKAHKVEQAMAKKRRRSEDPDKAPQPHEHKPNKGQGDNGLIGMCKECMQTTPLGSRIKSAILQAYLIRIRQLARLKRFGARKASSACNVRAHDDSFENCHHGASKVSNVARTSAAPSAGNSKRRKPVLLNMFDCRSASHSHSGQEIIDLGHNDDDKSEFLEELDFVSQCW